MNIRYTLSICFLLFFYAFSTQAQRFAYYPNGTKIPYKATTMRNVMDALGLSDVDIVSTSYGDVLYQKLTNKPVFLYLIKKEYVSKIPIMLKKYDYNDYIFSYSFYADLKRHLDSGKLSKAFLTETFGTVSREIEEEDGTKSLIFRKNNAKISFDGDSAVKVDVINYRAYDLHKTAILEYKVTGEDYSIGFDITISNLSDAEKIIKYVYITVTARNPVKDKIGTKTVRAIGPIKSGDYGDYSFENTFYSSTAKYLSLDAIKIQYMDGSIKLLNKAQTRAITSMDWEAEGNRTIDD